MSTMDSTLRSSTSYLQLQFLISFTLIVTLLNPVICAQEDSHNPLLGCGGFVRSPYKLDYSKIEIKLFTRQGSLKMRTECAPTTGYYFIPLLDDDGGEGDYILKINPPPGWIFEPTEYELQVDGVTDQCTQGIDINFDFKGFSVFGNVVTEGFTQGPTGVDLKLTSLQDSNLKFETRSRENGSFVFEKILPGKYLLKASSSSHSNLRLGKDSFTFELVNKNIVVDGEITVTGYQVLGKVKSDKNPVQGVQLVLLGSSSSPAGALLTNCDKDKLDGFTLPASIKNSLLTRVLCHQTSDSNGIFQFNNVRPGKYALVPVYKGKNIIYNVSPDHLEFEVRHESIELENWFEVEGFSVQGAVKGIQSGGVAKVFVNGELKATASGPNGEFVLPKMRPGVYNFEISAENVQFDKKKLTISPANPILPDFIPSKFLICGSVKLNQRAESEAPDLTFIFIDPATLKSTEKNIQTEKVIDLDQTCTYLKEGKYQITLASKPHKSFSPEKIHINVPTENSFTFQEFTGFISGSVSCTDKGQEIVVKLTSKSDEQKKTFEQIVKCGESYKFTDLEAGFYVISVQNSILCWENEKIDVELETTNVQNVNFKQVGYSLQLTSTHDTKIGIYAEDDKRQRKHVLDAELVRSIPNTICLKGGQGSSSSFYLIQPKGCHSFEKEVYEFRVGSDNNQIDLVALKHKYRGKIRSNGKINDLQIKKNGELIGSNAISASQSGTEYIYEIQFFEEGGKLIELEFFSYEFMLEPNSIQLETENDCQLNLFEVVGKKSYVIQGKLVPPLADVEIRVQLDGGQPDSTVYVRSNEAGEYIAGPFLNTIGLTVHPSKSGYTFKPMPSDPYSFHVLQWAKIQVKITDGSGNPIPNALLSLSGPNAYRLNKMTDSSGEMLFGDLQPGEYYLKPLLREFTFEPNAVNIELKEQETKVITLKASRESFSLYGSLSTLSGDLIPNLIVTAKGVANCSEYAEDGVSDEYGNFRIWALKAYCTYRVTVQTTNKNEVQNQLVERTIPEALEIKIGNTDTKDVSFILITPVKRMDVSLRVHTNSPKYLDGLRALVYSSANPDTPLHSVPFNGISYIILPPISTVDHGEYFITFESNLNRHHYDYNLPGQINFIADRAYEHFDVEFVVETVQLDHEIGRSSYFAFGLIILAFLIITYFDKISQIGKEYLDRFIQGSGAGGLGSGMGGSRKSKIKSSKAQ